MTTYTKHKLTNAQCKRLSQLSATDGRPHLHGNSLDALVQKGLAVEISGWEYPRTHDITPLGELALAAARKEGW